MTSYMIDPKDYLSALSRPTAGTPFDRGHLDEDGQHPDWTPGGQRQRDPDQGDVTSMFEHLLPDPPKYPKSAPYGSVLRNAARTMEYRPERDDPVMTRQNLPDRGEDREMVNYAGRGYFPPYATSQKPPSRADLDRYDESLGNAVAGGRMDVQTATMLQRAARAATEQGRQPRLGDDLGQTSQAVTGQTHSIIDNLLQQPSRNQAVRAPSPVETRGQAVPRAIPRTAAEAYQQAQARSAADNERIQAAKADLQRRIGERRTRTDAALADLRSRLGTPPSSISQPPTDLEAHARAEAQRLGINPDIAVRVANTEGGFGDPTRQNMEGAPAYGAYQLYVGGPSKPGLGDEALKRGIDPRKPEHARAAITFALEHAAKNGWGAFQGAAANGIGNWEGIGQQVAASTTVQQQQKAVQQGRSVWEAGKLTPNQLTEGMAQGLDRETALAVCGPAAAIAFARKMGRNPSLPEALDMAKKVGWTLQNGMAGPASQVKLLQNMGIPSRLEDGAPDASKIAAQISAGNPVILNSTRHYWVAENYDPKTGKFDFGESARVLKAAKGNSWFTLDEASKLGMGAFRGTIYMGAQGQ
jgi:hypothetical protein